MAAISLVGAGSRDKMKGLSCLFFILCIIVGGAQAEDGVEVKGGFFEDLSTRDFFSAEDRSKPAEGEEEGRGKSANEVDREKPKNRSSDGFDFDGQEPEVQHPSKILPVEDTTSSLKTRQENIKKNLDALKSIPINREEREKALEFYKKAIDQQDEVQTTSPSQGTPTTSSDTSAETAKRLENSRLTRASSSASEKATINLFVSANPTAHLEQALRELVELHKFSNVSVEKVYIIGYDMESHLKNILNEARREEIILVEDGKIKSQGMRRKHLPSVERYIEEHFEHFGLTEMDKALKTLKVETSPTWVVSVNKKLHVFEGSYNPGEFFDTEGAFVYPYQADKYEPRLGTPFARPRRNKKYGDTVRILVIKEPKNPVLLGAATEYLRPGAKRAGGLPNCVESRIRRKQVYHRSPQADFMDYLFYSGLDASQRETAKDWDGKKLSYQGFAKGRGYETNSSYYFALGLGIECLPTRFRVVNEHGLRFIEYREGRDAWHRDD